MGAHSAYIYQGILTDTSSFIEPFTEGRIALYEVVRVMHGVVLFQSDHLARLSQSAALTGLSLPVSSEEMTRDIQKLIQAHGVLEGNIRLLFLFGDKVEYWVHFMTHVYPSPAKYASGVRVGLLEAERTLPNAKIVQSSIRSQADALISRKRIFEVLLVHPGGYITEGSRSNFFAIKKYEVFTAPLADVLGGITRGQVLRICSQAGISVREERISVRALGNFESAFLTGTSPHVLPVSEAGLYKFDVQNPLLRSIMNGYVRLLEEYLTHFV